VSFYGVVLSTFLFCSVKTIYQGITHVINADNVDFKVEFDVFSYAIPFVSFVLDHSIKRIAGHTNAEKSVWVFLKLFLIVYYLGVYVMSLEVKGGKEEAR
jgi:hypothetical protein